LRANIDRSESLAVWKVISVDPVRLRGNSVSITRGGRESTACCGCECAGQSGTRGDGWLLSPGMKVSMEIQSFEHRNRGTKEPERLGIRDDERAAAAT